MAASGLAIELPTNRQSGYYGGPPPNVHDPNYIPVLNGADLRVDFSQQTFSAIPSIPTPHENESQTSLKRSKSASAPETVVQYRNASPMPPRPALSRYATPQEIGSSHQPRSEPRQDARSSSNSGNNTVSGSDSSSPDPAVALEESVFMIPGNSAPKIDELQFPAVPSSARSSISSVRKSHAPTSRYNKKSPSVPSLPPNIPQKTQIASASSAASLEINPHQAFESAQSTPALPSAIESSPPTPAMAIPRLQAMKSTASERRARALHSHPSNISSRSRRNSTVKETDETPLIVERPQSESRPSSSRSRSRSMSQSICNSTQLFPAPSAPLPDLPPGAKRPPTREKPADKPLPMLNPSSLSSPPLNAAQNDHVEMAEFMTTQKVTIFRRFDEVHVRLLLQLQDEISSLEESLKEIENVGSGRPDHVSAKSNVMMKLRKLMAEYDHLFANWSSMQANRATPEAKEKLERWLQSPSLMTGGISKDAMDDLQWLHDTKDLSSVSIDVEKTSGTVQKSESISKTSSQSGSGEKAGDRGGGRKGGFLALFGCASKRK